VGSAFFSVLQKFRLKRVSCEALPGKNGSRLCVKFEIKDGRIAVDRTRSIFVPSSLFLERLSIPRSDGEQISMLN
jgi:hypothetical protein